LEQTTDLAFQGSAIQGAAGFLESAVQTGKPLLDARREALVHGLLLLPSLS